MELDKRQKSIILSRPFGMSIIKGLKGYGKSTTMMYRILYLKNNYCLYDSDGILFVCTGKTNKEDVMKKYKEIDEKENIKFNTLFSKDKDIVEFVHIDEILKLYMDKYKQENSEVRIVNLDMQRDIMYKCMSELKKEYTRSRILTLDYVEFFIDEIMWIKKHNLINVNEYLVVNRRGRKNSDIKMPSRLPKNSKQRQIIYKVNEAYNRALKDYGYIDEENKVSLIDQYIKNNNNKKYTYLFIDDIQNLSDSELKILFNFSNGSVYSGIMLSMDSSVKKSILDKDLIKDAKTFILKNNYSCGNDKIQENKNMFIENYQYVDIRHGGKIRDFYRDSSKVDEVIINDESESLCSKSELAQLPMYSDIAAGEPILMNSEIESSFYLPNYWLKGLKDCFMLHVKGDSMKNANIEDGDFVVLKRQNNAQNGDVVAVDLDGSATLKRLRIEKDNVYLKPENPKYNNIPLYGVNFNLLGIVVGIIKCK
jgi:SOS regulatory protein LexA